MMKSLNVLLSVCILFASLILSHGQEIVKTKSGRLSGASANGVFIFKGIPFAAPPVGELRWQAPQPVKPWKGILECKNFGPSPMQSNPVPFRMWTQEFIAPAKPLSEDCLYLNVWTPSVSPAQKLPVLVWIYGGGFVSGSAACPIYDGEEIAKMGIVYVAINYRVGVFGFMAHPELTAESKTKSSGNYGLMDQIAALKWIKENISAFGGDPEKVTIAGQSAGAFSVQALVASPLTTGLFRGAIAQSGALTGRPSVSLATAEKSGATLSGKTKLKNLAALRALPADSILTLASTLPFGTFSPIVDGHVLPSGAREIFERHRHHDVPVMLGWVTGDGNVSSAAPPSAEKFRGNAKAAYGDRTEEFFSMFPAQTEEDVKTSQQRLGMLQFAGFPDYEWALWNNNNSYVYQFRYVPTDKPGFPNFGAFHTSEVPFALHTLGKWDRPWTSVDYSVQKYMSAYWVNFVKNGNPNGSELPDWKPFTAGEGAIMEFGETPALTPGLYKKEFAFLKSARR
jgi:para-nitrobenzyl esterase